MRTEESGGRRGGRSQGLSRRRLLLGATATAGLLTLGQGDWVQTTAQTDGLPTPEASGIAHIVWVMMENRSFDHFLGWVEGADGKQAGLTYPDRMGNLQPTYRLAPDFQGCGHRNTRRGLPALAGRGMRVLRQQDSLFPLALSC